MKLFLTIITSCLLITLSGQIVPKIDTTVDTLRFFENKTQDKNDGKFEMTEIGVRYAPSSITTFTSEDKIMNYLAIKSPIFNGLATMTIKYLVNVQDDGDGIKIYLTECQQKEDEPLMKVQFIYYNEEFLGLTVFVKEEGNIEPSAGIRFEK